MVHAVHADPMLADDLTQHAALGDGDAVGHAVSVLYHEVPLSGHRWQVLDERSAESDVDHLSAPADAEQGQALLHREANERDLERIALVVDCGGLGPGCLAIAQRVHITTTGQDETVEPTSDLGRAEAGDRRQDSRQTTGGNDRRGVFPLRDVGEAIANDHAGRGQADGRPHGTRWRRGHRSRRGDPGHGASEGSALASSSRATIWRKNARIDSSTCSREDTRWNSWPSSSSSRYSTLWPRARRAATSWCASPGGTLESSAPWITRSGARIVSRCRIGETLARNHASCSGSPYFVTAARAIHGSVSR